ncbi:hypothetical protein Tco_0325815 [Tanacetum coccineum]
MSNMNGGLLGVLSVKSLIMMMMVVHLGLGRPVAKPNATNGNTSTSNNPPSPKEVIKGAAKPIVSHKVPMNDSSCSTNVNGYFKDDINIG